MKRVHLNADLMRGHHQWLAYADNYGALPGHPGACFYIVSWQFDPKSFIPRIHIRGRRSDALVARLKDVVPGDPRPDIRHWCFPHGSFSSLFGYRFGPFVDDPHAAAFELHFDLVAHAKLLDAIEDAGAFSLLVERSEPREWQVMTIEVTESLNSARTWWADRQREYSSPLRP